VGECVYTCEDMIAFEIFLQENGFDIVAGSVGPFNTYNNTSRSWKNKDGKSCLVGLYANPTRIGIIYPYVYLDDVVDGWLSFSNEVFSVFIICFFNDILWWKTPPRLAAIRYALILMNKKSCIFPFTIQIKLLSSNPVCR